MFALVTTGRVLTNALGGIVYLLRNTRGACCLQTEAVQSSHPEARRQAEEVSCSSWHQLLSQPPAGQWLALAAIQLHPTVHPHCWYTSQALAA